MIVTLDRASLRLAEIDAVARGGGAKVAISDNPAVLARVRGSREVIAGVVERGEEI